MTTEQRQESITEAVNLLDQANLLAMRLARDLRNSHDTPAAEEIDEIAYQISGARNDLEALL